MCSLQLLSQSSTDINAKQEYFYETPLELINWNISKSGDFFLKEFENNHGFVKFTF